MNTPLLSVCAILSASTALAQVPGNTPGDLGSVTVNMQGTPVTYTTVRAADGNAWLQQNLGSSGVATSIADTASYGSYYQWGRWSDGHQLPTSTVAQASVLSPNNPLGLDAGSPLFYVGNATDWWNAGSDLDAWQGSTATGSTGIDPCAAMGAGWKLPDLAEWTALIAAEGITNTATAFSSNLRLPAAGSREGVLGGINNVGSFGNYWASTPNTVYAKDVTIGDSFVNGQDDALRSYGMCVRCLNAALHTGIRESGREELRAYPNPAADVLHIEGTSMVDRITLITADGRVVLDRGVNASRVLVPVADLTEGVYMLGITNANGRSMRTVVIAR